MAGSAPWARIWNGWTDVADLALEPVAGVRRLAEAPLAGPVPRFEVPGWREEFGVVAGITGRGPAGAPFDLGLGTRSPVGRGDRPVGRPAAGRARLWRMGDRPSGPWVDDPGA